MTNHNKRLDEILSKTPCVQCDGSGAYPDYDGEPVQCQFCWQLRFTFIDKTKQAITSLTKELVAEARIKEVEYSVGQLESSEEYAVRRIAELREKVGQDDTK